MSVNLREALAELELHERQRVKLFAAVLSAAHHEPDASLTAAEAELLDAVRLETREAVRSAVLAASLERLEAQL
jgi:hypothetical protein